MRTLAMHTLRPARRDATRPAGTTRRTEPSLPSPDGRALIVLADGRCLDAHGDERQGVLYVRSHADVSESSLTALQALLEVREEVKDWITLQVVAFPQDGIYSHPKNDHLLETAMEMGADAVGGIPHYELSREDGVKSIQRIFELAQKYDRLIHAPVSPSSS